MLKIGEPVEQATPSQRSHSFIKSEDESPSNPKDVFHKKRYKPANTFNVIYIYLNNIENQSDQS